MEMVIAKPKYVNAQLIMSMHKIAHYGCKFFVSLDITVLLQDLIT